MVGSQPHPCRGIIQCPPAPGLKLLKSVVQAVWWSLLAPKALNWTESQCLCLPLFPLPTSSAQEGSQELLAGLGPWRGKMTHLCLWMFYSNEQPPPPLPVCMLSIYHVLSTVLGALIPQGRRQGQELVHLKRVNWTIVYNEVWYLLNSYVSLVARNKTQFKLA